MSEKPGNSEGRFKGFALWQWGLLLIVWGPLGSMGSDLILSPQNAAEANGQAFGRGVVALVSVSVGLILVMVDLLRSLRR